MRVASTIRIPVPQKSYAAVIPGNDVPTSVVPTVDFKLMRGPEKQDIFFECQAGNGCPGAGCPTFTVDADEIPEEIIQHLKNHVQMCRGIFPDKLPA